SFVSVSASPAIYTLSLHDALPISQSGVGPVRVAREGVLHQAQLHLGGVLGIGAVVPGCVPQVEQRLLVRRAVGGVGGGEVLGARSEEHTSELQSRENLVCRLLLEK